MDYADDANGDRYSVSVFLPNIFQPEDRSIILPSDRILLVRNKKRDAKGNRPSKKAGWGMPGGHGKDHEFYIDAAYRELEEETGIKHVTMLNRREMFLFKEWKDTEREPEEKNGKLVRKSHWHYTVGSRILVPDNEIAITIGKEDIAMAAWYRFDQLDQLPNSNLYRTHGERIHELYTRLENEELFNEIFNTT